MQRSLASVWVPVLLAALGLPCLCAQSGAIRDVHDPCIVKAGGEC